MSASANPKFRLTLARGFRSEQEYIATVLLREFLGLNVEINEVSNAISSATLSAGGRSLHLPQELFREPEAEGGIVGRSPRQPLPRLDVAAEGLPLDRFCGPQVPIIFGTPQQGAWVVRREGSSTLHADVLGGSLFMLTRLEEVRSTVRDEHGCFPARFSLAWAEGFLARPIVNEYAELLWQAMVGLWPDLQRPPRRFCVRISHDVDRPWAYAEAGLRDRFWLIRHHMKSGLFPTWRGSRILNAMLVLLDLPHEDPFDTFEELMASDEAAGLKATFNFLGGRSSRYDGTYDIGSRSMRRLLRAVHARGHSIGLHGSYNTIEDASRLIRERQRLTTILREEGIDVEVAGGRQHYLRWRAPQTWRAWEQAALSYDSSLGFWDALGFRCGSCYEYPVFDVLARRPLRLRERPLHVMDIALIAPGSQTTLSEVRRAVHRYNGVFEILWHNNTLAEWPGSGDLYRRSIAREEA